MLVATWRMKLAVPAKVPLPDYSVLQTEDGAKEAAEEWERQWQMTAARFQVPEIEEVSLPPNRRHTVLGLEELGILVVRDAQGMLMDDGTFVNQTGLVGGTWEARTRGSYVQLKIHWLAYCSVIIECCNGGRAS